MTSIVTNKGQTIVPKPLRKRFALAPGTRLDWEVEGGSMRVVKRGRASKGNLVRALRRLGRVPAAPRDRRPVEDR